MYRNKLELVHAGLSLHRHLLQLRVLLYAWEDQQRRGRRMRTIWVREWLSRRSQFGIYEQLLEELRREDVVAFKIFLRVNLAMFREIVDRPTVRLQKKDTWYRKALPVALKDTLSLRHLATGDSYHSLMYSLRVAHNTISNVVAEVCEALLLKKINGVILHVSLVLRGSFIMSLEH